MKKVAENEMVSKALDMIAESGENLSELLREKGLMSQMVKGLVERALAGEMQDHLGYGKYERGLGDNNRNGVSKKQLITEQGKMEIEVPRDREGTFDPALLPKRATRIEGLDDKVLSLYAKGMSVRDIQTQLKELYSGAEISTGLISQITNEVLEEVEIWQSRPLETIYAIVYFDCFFVKVRQDKRILNKAVYVALGIDLEGRKDILGLWMSENESAKFWLNNLTALKNRGLSDILIACTDNLPGLSEAISSVYPKVEHQLCIVHQIRNSLKYVSYKDRKTLVCDLKAIYQAPTEDAALLALEAFQKKWDAQYPQISKSWYANWDNLATFLQYPPEIRRVIYTTNPIESLNSQLRKVTKNKRVFPNDEAVFKTLFLAIGYITQKWILPIKNWNEAMAHFLIKFDNRI